MDRKQLKKEAAYLCKNAKPSPILMGLLFSVLTLIVQTLSAGVLGTNISEENVSRYLYSLYNGNLERAVEFAGELQPTAAGSLISTMLTVVMWIVTAGFVIFIMNTIRGSGASFGNLLDGFGMTWRVILVNLLSGLFIGLLSLLLIVPGVLFFYGYRQALFLVLDRPELSVMQCLKESRRMMKGHKWELFKLDLSFVGWTLLAAFIQPVEIWTVPYMKTVYLLYYERLCGRTEPFYE